MIPTPSPDPDRDSLAVVAPRRHRGWAILGVATIALGLAANAAIFSSLDRATERVFEAPRLQHDVTLHRLAAAFNWWGGPGVIAFAVVLWLGGRVGKRRGLAEAGLWGGAAIALTSAIGGLTKALVGRARPSLTPGEPWHWELAHGWTDAAYFSMPSGHTATTFALAVAITIVARRRASAPVVACVIAAWVSAILVGFARVYSHQHWLTDVMVGALLGMSVGMGVGVWAGAGITGVRGAAFTGAVEARGEHGSSK